MIGFIPDDYDTPVVFRKPRAKSLAHEITAVFPCEPANLNGYDFTVYAHVGQHSSACMEWYHGTRAAKPEEYAALKAELEGAPYGYRLKVYRRIQPWMRDARFAEARRLRDMQKANRTMSDAIDQELRR